MQVEHFPGATPMLWDLSPNSLMMATLRSLASHTLHWWVVFCCSVSPLQFYFRTCDKQFLFNMYGIQFLHTHLQACHCLHYCFLFLFFAGQFNTATVSQKVWLTFHYRPIGCPSLCLLLGNTSCWWSWRETDTVSSCSHDHLQAHAHASGRRTVPASTLQNSHHIPQPGQHDCQAQASRLHAHHQWVSTDA